MMKFHEIEECPKCGSNVLDIRYRPQFQLNSSINPDLPGPRWVDDEHLHISCNECSYTFAMACKDA